MHVLVISPTPTFPADQGNRQRVRNVCRALQLRGASIHFAYFPREWGGRFSRTEHSEMTREWEFFDTIVPSKPFVYQTSERYFGIDDWWDDAIGRFIQYKCSGMAFDACIVNYAFFSKAFEYLPRSVIRILDTHDRLSGRREMLENNGVAPEFFYTSEEQEKIALDRSDVVVAINSEEAVVFRSMTNKPVITLGHVAERQALAIPRRAASTKVQRMGFLGSSNSVNVKNINDFFKALAQQVPDGIPAIEFHLFGGCCSHVQLPPELKPHVKVHGRIDSVNDFYANVDCVFVPFLFGTGQKIKLIEALSFGKPLIATTSASEGSGSTTDMHLLESFDEVIAAIKTFGVDRKFRAKLAEDTAREFTRYETTVSRSVDTLFEIASLNSMQVNIDRKVVAQTFRNKSHAEVTNAVVRVMAVLDLLDSAGPLRDKPAAIQVLLDGISDAESGEKPAAASAATIEQAGATQVILQGLSSNTTDATSSIQVRVHLPSLGESLAPVEQPAIDIHVDCRPKAIAANQGSLLPPEAIRTPTFAQNDRRFDRFDQIVVLVDDLQAADPTDLLKAIAGQLSLRTSSKATIWCVDRKGQRARWDTGSLVQEVAATNPLDALLAARALVLSKPSLTVAHGFSHTSADALHRVLIADGGPLVSFVQGRLLPMDGELVARNEHEAALWVAQCVTAPRWASIMAQRLRASVSANESMDVIAHRLHHAINAVKSRHIALQIAALAAQEDAAHTTSAQDISMLVQKSASA